MCDAPAVHLIVSNWNIVIIGDKHSMLWDLTVIDRLEYKSDDDDDDKQYFCVIIFSFFRKWLLYDTQNLILLTYSLY